MLSCQRHLFSIPDDIAYLNTAYMSPQLKAVDAIGMEAMVRKNQPWSITVEDFYEPVRRLKALFNELIEGESPERVALVPSVSYGMATIAQNLNLEEGDEIILLDEQFPSNVLTWQRLAEQQGAKLTSISAPPAGTNRGVLWNQAILGAIGPKTRLVAIGHIHWADGTWFDLKAIREKSRYHNALLVIDGTQSVGALPFSIKEFQPDALICGGYKWLLGPYSLSLAYYGPAFDGGIPIEENWYNRLNSHDFAGLVNYQPEYGPLAQRYSVGESSNFALVPMLTKALEQILAWGVPNINAYSKKITKSFLTRVAEAGLMMADQPDRTHHLLGLMLPKGIDTTQLKDDLAREQVFVSIRGNAMRISAHVYNRPVELDKLFLLLEKQLKVSVG